MAVSGYAQFLFSNEDELGGPIGSTTSLRGDGDSDSKWVAWTVQMVVGPKMRAIRCAVPSVSVAGFSFNDSDTVDDSGWHIDAVRWNTEGEPPPEDLLERLRLEVDIRIRGGDGFAITKLGYHAILVGRQ